MIRELGGIDGGKGKYRGIGKETEVFRKTIQEGTRVSQVRGSLEQEN